MHAALDNHIALGFGRFDRQLQAVANDIGNAVKNFRRLVIMRQNDGIFLFFQLVNGLDIGRKKRPFDRRNDAFDTFIKRRHIARQTVGIGNIHFFQNARTALSRRCGYGVVNQAFTGSKHSRPLFILTLSIIVIL